MVIPAAESIHLYKLPIGRAAFALGHVHDRAEELGQTEIAELARRAGDECRLTLALALRLKAGHQGLYPPEATAMDGLVDRCLGGTHGYLDSQMRFFPGEPRGDAAGRIMQTIFPDGVAAVTHLPYAEEQAHVTMLLEQLESEELAEDVALLPGFPELIARLRQRNREYGEVLRAAGDVPTRDELRAAQQRCRDLVAAVVALALGLYALRAPDRRDEVEHVLEPIWRQNEAVRILRRRRGIPTDVDPENGEENGEDLETDSVVDAGDELETGDGAEDIDDVAEADELVAGQGADAPQAAGSPAA